MTSRGTPTIIGSSLAGRSWQPCRSVSVGRASLGRLRDGKPLRFGALEGCSNEVAEQRMRTGRAALELRVELRGDEERMIRQLDHFTELVVDRRSTDAETCCFELLAVPVVHFEAVAVALEDDLVAVGRARLC